MKWRRIQIKGTANPNEVLYSYWQSDDGGYKITQCLAHDGFSAFYVGPGADRGSYVSPPPDKLKCRGCGSAHCAGHHMAWRTFKAAKEACLVHKADLPW